MRQSVETRQEFNVVRALTFPQHDMNDSRQVNSEEGANDGQSLRGHSTFLCAVHFSCSEKLEAAMAAPSPGNKS
jgi:hypothetical protein